MQKLTDIISEEVAPPGGPPHSTNVLCSPEVVRECFRPLGQQLHQVLCEPGGARLAGSCGAAQALLRLAEAAHPGQEVVGLDEEAGGEQECEQVGPVRVVDVGWDHVLD